MPWQLAAQRTGAVIRAIPIGEDGQMVGAVNILIDVTDRRQAGALRAQAMRCRRLAQSLTDQQAVNTLLLMASEYDAKAETLRTG